MLRRVACGTSSTRIVLEITRHTNSMITKQNPGSRTEIFIEVGGCHNIMKTLDVYRLFISQRIRSMVPLRESMLLLITLIFGWILPEARSEVVFDTEAISKAAGPSVVLLTSESTKGKSLGSGFFIREDGLIVTNAHVIAGAKSIMAKNNQGAYFRITDVLAQDDGLDIAILKAEGNNLPVLKIADDQSITQGARIAVIGNPAGLEFSISDGIISAIREDGSRSILQITAPISPGSSGAPVLNAKAEVAGIATFKVLKGDSLNFAIVSRHVEGILNKALRNLASKGEATGRGMHASNTISEASVAEDAQLKQESDYKKLMDIEAGQQPSLILSIAKKMAEKYPRSALAQRRLSDAFYYAGFHQEAVDVCRKAIDLDPDNPRGWDNLALALIQIGDMEEAEQSIKKALILKPTDVKAWIDYATIISAKTAESALDAIKHAEANITNPEAFDEESRNYDLRSQISLFYNSIGRHQDAYNHAHIATLEKPNSHAAHLAHAYAALSLRKYNEIKPALDRVASLVNPRPVLIYTILGISYAEQGYIDEAIATFEKGLEIDAQNKDALMQLAIIHANRPGRTLSDYRKALDYAERISAIDQNLGNRVYDEINKSGPP